MSLAVIGQRLNESAPKTFRRQSVLFEIACQIWLYIICVESLKRDRVPRWLSFIPAILYVVGLILGVSGVALPGAAAALPPLAQWMLFASLGLMSLWAFLGHVFVAEPVARSIGWSTSPFQFEVGVANLGIGVSAIAATWLGITAGWAVFLMSACFLWGAAFEHARDVVKERNFSINNIGPIFWWDILTPLTLLIGLLQTKI